MHLPSRRIFFSTAAGGAVACGAAYAQEPEATFTTDTRLVPLYATVVNSKGQLVTDLPRTAFKVLENNVEQPIKDFKREDVPVSLGLIVDNSGSMRDRRQKVEAAAIAMVKASNPLDQVFVVNFNDEAYEDVPFTSDIKKMEDGLSRIDSRGGTAFYDAISLSLDNVVKGKRDKRVLMLITDGNDNASSTTLEKLLAKTGRSNVVIHVIGLLSTEEPREARKAQRALKQIAESTGGLCFFPKELEEVEKLALQVAHDIRNQYVITYSPLNASLDGSYRTIKVTAKGPNSPVVRTRSGYYATPTQREPKKLSQNR
jgi:Ca-activated chloride channel family protein